MISAAGTAQAQQQQQPASTQPAPPTVAKADNADKVTCRIHMEGNLPRRICMTNSQWKKIDSQSADGSQTYTRMQCGATTVAGAC
jgi:hypothetical protein